MLNQLTRNVAVALVLGLLLDPSYALSVSRPPISHSSFATDQAILAPLISAHFFGMTRMNWRRFKIFQWAAVFSEPPDLTVLPPEKAARLPLRQYAFWQRARLIVLDNSLTFHALTEAQMRIFVELEIAELLRERTPSELKNAEEYMRRFSHRPTTVNEMNSSLTIDAARSLADLNAKFNQKTGTILAPLQKAIDEIHADFREAAAAAEARERIRLLWRAPLAERLRRVPGLFLFDRTPWIHYLKTAPSMRLFGVYLLLAGALFPFLEVGIFNHAAQGLLPPFLERHFAGPAAAAFIKFLSYFIAVPFFTQLHYIPELRRGVLVEPWEMTLRLAVSILFFYAYRAGGFTAALAAHAGWNVFASLWNRFLSKKTKIHLPVLILGPTRPREASSLLIKDIRLSARSA